ncbi:MAG TPA: hypothetical protein VE616_06925 [Candidatus Udaeobacter sp.]|jgi:hypothetical protein|nr:hypothetical protein [Candidatus Udaeobacter sp.]
MAFYAVDVLDGVIRRVTDEYSGVDNKRFFLIEAGSAKQAWAKANPEGKRLAAPIVGTAAIVVVAFAKNAPSQDNILTTGFVTAAGS